MEYRIPEIIQQTHDEVTGPRPNVKILAQANGLPTNVGELKSIVIDKFGLSKFELNSYLKGVNYVKSLTNDNTQTTYNGKVGSVPAQDAPIAYSSLNTPLWDYIVFEGDSYVDRSLAYNTDANGRPLPNVTYDEQRIDTMLISLSQSHSLVLTEIQGRDNEVVEYVGKKSFRINFKGGVYGNNNNRPKAEIANIQKMLNSNKPLKVKFCSFLAEWNITEIYVLDKSIPQTMGGYNFQLFEFNAIQNVPVILASQQSV